MYFFETGNPISVFVYFAAAAFCPMFCNNPIIVLMSMMGALVTYFSLGGKCRFKDHFFFVLLFVVGTVINPVFNHNGQTVLFFVNDNPITLEALVWGAVSSGTIVSVIYWFRAFSLVMTGDRLLYVFGAFSPKMALMLSMALRYIPLFGIQAEKVDAAQKAVGAGGKDDIWGRIKAKLRVFWVMVTWTLENGITTADSMEARGYGSGKRTFFSLYRFRFRDGAVLTASLVFASAFLVSLGLGALDFEFYPTFESVAFGGLSWLGSGAYFALGAMPAIIKIGEEIRWKYLKSGI